MSVAYVLVIYINRPFFFFFLTFASDDGTILNFKSMVF